MYIDVISFPVFPLLVTMLRRKQIISVILFHKQNHIKQEPSDVKSKLGNQALQTEPRAQTIGETALQRRHC